MKQLTNNQILNVSGGIDVSAVAELSFLGFGGIALTKVGADFGAIIGNISGLSTRSQHPFCAGAGWGLMLTAASLGNIIGIMAATTLIVAGKRLYNQWDAK